MEKRDLRLTFGEDVKNYEALRPTYPDTLFSAILAYEPMNAEKCALEIGIGTGQATLPILKTGCRVEAVELSSSMAEYVEKKFSGNSRFSVSVSSFEAYEKEEESFDLIYAATAFHWIPEAEGYPKAFRLLKKGGALALFWNRPYAARESDPLHREIQKIYRKYRPDSAKFREEYEAKRYQRLQETMERYGFVDTEFHLFHRIREFTADAYLALLNTYSDHRAMEPEIRKAFCGEMHRAISEYGNCMRVYDSIDLYLGRKPE